MMGAVWVQGKCRFPNALFRRAHNAAPARATGFDGCFASARVAAGYRPVTIALRVAAIVGIASLAIDHEPGHVRTPKQAGATGRRKAAG